MPNLWNFNEDGTGLKFALTEDLLSEIQEAVRVVLGNDLSLDPSTPQGQLISARVESDENLIAGIEMLANSLFNGGSGAMLDIWAWNQFRATRRKAVNGYVVITIEGKAGVFIPSNFQISDGSLNYTIEKETTIPDNGTIDINFICDKVTDQISLQNTIQNIITPIVGVDRVNNKSSSIAGIFEESDSAFYQRCMKFGSLFKNSTFRSIQANIAEVAGVIKSAGYENATNKQVTYKGTTFPSHSFGIVVLGGSDQDVAQGIADSKGVGDQSTGDQEVKLSINKVENIYKFYRAKPTAIKVSVDCSIDARSPSSYQQFVKEAVTAYVNSLEIGAYITQPEMCKAIEAKISGFQLNAVQIGKKDGSLGTSPIKLEFTELATIADEDIAVTGSEVNNT